MKQLLSIIAHNRPGVLSKITGLISRRGYNIDSLMSGTTDADDRTVDQISRQVEKISEVEKITVLKKETSALRSMLLIKVHAGDKRMEILQLLVKGRGLRSGVPALPAFVSPGLLLSSLV